MVMVLDILLRKMVFLCEFIYLLLRWEKCPHAVMHSCASSKHLQTRRFLDTLQGYLYDIQRILVQLHRAANARPAPFVDHLGILRDSKTGRPINGIAYDDSTDENQDETAEAIPMRECFLLNLSCGYVAFGFRVSENGISRTDGSTEHFRCICRDSTLLSSFRLSILVLTCVCCAT